MVGVLAFFFYRSALASIPLAVVGYLFFCQIKRRKIEHCKKELVCQFKECILSVSASLKAGYAIENAILESRSDMQLLYGENSLIYEELELIRRGLIINISLEEQLMDLAIRSGCEEIRQFAQVFSIARKNGGNIPEIIQVSVDLIGQRIEVRQELLTMLSGRKMEQNIMKWMPFGILGYISISNPGYFDSLYHNWQGAAIMTGCLGIYLAGYALGENIFWNITRKVG